MPASKPATKRAPRKTAEKIETRRDRYVIPPSINIKALKREVKQEQPARTWSTASLVASVALTVAVMLMLERVGAF